MSGPKLYQFTMAQLMKIWNYGREGIHFSSRSDSEVVKTIITGEILNTPFNRKELFVQGIALNCQVGKPKQYILNCASTLNHIKNSVSDKEFMDLIFSIHNQSNYKNIKVLLQWDVNNDS